MSCKEAFTSGTLEKTEEQKCANPEQEINPLTSSHVRSFCKLKATEILLLIHMFLKATLLLYFYSIDYISPQKSSYSKYVKKDTILYRIYTIKMSNYCQPKQ